jgi:nicotinate-nucleotide--dimethylbenzimidazole phosphoribosyltransferase
LIEAMLFDIGGTLVRPAAPTTPLDALEADLLPGVARTLAAVSRHVRIGAVSDTSVMTEADVRRLLEPSGVGGLLDAVVTSVDVGARKPDTAGLVEALRRLAISDPAHAVFVGDSDVDRDAAAALGMSFVRVTSDGVPPLHDVLRTWLRDQVGTFEASRMLVAPLDDTARSAATDYQSQLTKPPGSLGRVEDLGVRLAAIAGVCPPPMPSPAVVGVFAGDHGVLAQGVSPWPQEVTAQMVANFASGGAAINVLARRAGALVTVVDVGVATPLPADLDGVLRRRVRSGTRDLALGAALTIDEARAALDVGGSIAASAVAGGAGALVTGDMGIGNTTPAAALVAAFTGLDANDVTGRGTGIDDQTLARKAEIVAAAVARAAGAETNPDPLTVLAEVGGLEHAALAGFIIGGAAARVPIVVDGVIALSALLVAEALAPGVSDYTIAGHRSVEPGASAALAHLGMKPVLDLDLRLGEGTGACLALPIVEAAAAVLQEMATFDSAGVTEKHAH